MSRGPQSFKQGDVTKAIKAAMAAGLPVGRVEISPDGRIILVADKPEPEQNSGVISDGDDLDRELADFEARHAG
jgi:hypothetical protein